MVILHFADSSSFRSRKPRLTLCQARLGFLGLACLAVVLGGFVNSASAQTTTVRFATYNAALNRCLGGSTNPCLAGGLVEALSDGDYLQARQIAEIVQRVRPDVLLLNEFNYDAEGAAADLFQQNYLSIGQNVSRSDEAAAPIDYPFRYLAPVNTGVASGFDLDNDGQVVTEPGTGDYGNDALGFGEFPGRYGMVLLSRFPLDLEKARTFQQFLWKQMPDALIPDNSSTPAPDDWYSEAELEVMRLSSKSHWDVPVRVGDTTIHVLASHPTPPVFDGPEDRNGRRNHDEIRLWSDYVSVSGSDADYLVDDAGQRGGLAPSDSFIIMGDLNADPEQGDSYPGAAQQLLSHPRIDSSQVPTTFSGSTNTSSFDLRVDYVLPSADLTLTETAIFRPPNSDPTARLLRASDHLLVWADVEVPSVPEPSSACLLLGGGLLATRGMRRRRGEPSRVR